MHVSLRDASGKNIFATEAREDAAFSDTRYLSQIGEHFLAGILDGIADGI